MSVSSTITALKGAKWYLVFAVFLAFNIYMFRDEIAKFLDLSTEEVFKGDIAPIINQNIFIDKLLRNIMHQSGADRAYIFRFHNGQNYFDGTHKIRMSCDFEVVGKGIEPQAARLIDLPTSLFSWFIKESMEYRMFYLDIDSISDMTTKIALEEQGIRSIAVAPYFNEQGNLVALIGVDWVGRPANRDTILKNQGLEDSEWNSGHQKEIFINACQNIGNALNYSF